MSIDLSILEDKADEALNRAIATEGRVGALESATWSLKSCTPHLATTGDLDLLRTQLTELYDITHALRHSVEQIDSRLNSLSANQLL